MLNCTVSDLLLNRPNNYIDSSIISKEQIRILLSLLESILKNNIEGDIVEFGCYVGESSKYLRMMLDYHRSDKELYVYDSFEGLPALSKYEEGTGWRSGTLCTTENVLKHNFLNNGLRPPIIHKNWFKNIPSNKIPNKISFAFLDGDFYDSIYDSLFKIFNNVSTGGIICLHDYNRQDLPGVRAAVDDFLKNNNISNYLQFEIFHQLGVIIKL